MEETMPLTYRLIALAVVLGLVGALGYDYNRLRGQLKTAQEAAKSARQSEQKVRTVIVYREKLRAATAAETTEKAASAAATLEKYQDWANTPVPKEVQDALAP